MREWRTAMVGAITLHDAQQVRQGTLYAASAPPVEEVDKAGKGTGKKGKAAFWAVMDREVAVLKVRYPDAMYVGLSDGAADLLPWLARHTSVQVLDFYHANGYVHAAAAAFRHEPVPRRGGRRGLVGRRRPAVICVMTKGPPRRSWRLFKNGWPARAACRIPPAKPCRKPPPASATTRGTWTMRRMKPPDSRWAAA